MKTCTAVVDGNRIQLDINKEDEGYKEFALVLHDIEKYGCLSWYGDICLPDGTERSGLVITAGKY